MPQVLSYGNFSVPFDEEIFAMYLEDEPDLVSDAFIQSGVMVEDGYIASLIANGSNTYTIPFYNNLEQVTADNYDGDTDITLSTMGASYQSGVVYGRAKGWTAKDFIADFSTANPLAAIAARVNKYWRIDKQQRLLGIVEGVLGVKDMAANVITKDALEPTTISDATQEIWGDRKNNASLIICHSKVAQGFEDMERVDYRTYTSPTGVTESLPIYEVNGLTVIVYDGVPTTAAAEGTAATYTTYLFGQGAIKTASAPVAHPTFWGREELVNGGEEYFGNRIRETIHPNGFSYTLPKPDAKSKQKIVVSPTDEQLAATANWALAYSDPRAIPFGKVITPAYK